MVFLGNVKALDDPGDSSNSTSNADDCVDMMEEKGYVATGCVWGYGGRGWDSVVRAHLW